MRTGTPRHSIISLVASAFGLMSVPAAISPGLQKHFADIGPLPAPGKAKGHGWDKSHGKRRTRTQPQISRRNRRQAARKAAARRMGAPR